jgi:hypothetical protein
MVSWALTPGSSVRILRRFGGTCCRVPYRPSYPGFEWLFACSLSNVPIIRHIQFNSEDGGSMLLRNVGMCLQYYTVLQPRNLSLNSVTVIVQRFVRTSCRAMEPSACLNFSDVCRTKGSLTMRHFGPDNENRTHTYRTMSGIFFIISIRNNRFFTKIRISYMPHLSDPCLRWFQHGVIANFWGGSKFYSEYFNAGYWTCL